MRTLGPALAALLLLTACSSSSSTNAESPRQARVSASATPTSDPRPLVAQVAWKAKRDDPVSEIAGFGHVGVVYVARNGRLALLGFDLRNGHELWSRPGPPVQPWGLRPVVLDADTVGVVLADGSPYVAGLDPRTGRSRWQGPRWRWLDNMWRCGDNDDRLCAQHREGREDAETTMFDAAGRHRPAPPLHDRLSIEDGVAAWTTSGHLAWKRRIADLKPGWVSHQWWQGAHHGRLLVDVAAAKPGKTLSPDEIAVWALDAADGHLVWSLPGARVCPLAMPDGTTRVGGAGADVGELPRFETFCVFHGGTLIDRWSGRGEHDTATDLVGVDLVTGRQLWRRPQQPGFGSMEETVPSTDLEHAYVESQTGEELIDVETGKSAPVPDDYVVWEEVTWTITSGSGVPDANAPRHSGQWRPTREGQQLRVVPWPIPDTLGVVDGDLHVLGTDDALVGYRAAPAATDAPAR